MKHILITTLITIILLTGCDLFTESIDLSSDAPDAIGNLLISNHSGERLVLFEGETRLKIIPSSSSDYLVNISNPNGLTLELRLYKLADIEGDIDNPDLDFVFKNWAQNFPSDTDPEHRYTWHVTANDVEINSGTVHFSYYGAGEVNVDVFLNSITGAKLMTLRPREQYGAQGIDYDYYTVIYQYWTSDQGTSNGRQNLGTIETEMKNGSEVDITLNVNYENSPVYMTIPTWDNGQIDAETGSIRIKNMTAEPVQIWAGNTLIETIMISENPTQNASTISAGNSTTYELPIGPYEFTAKKLSGEEVEMHTITIYQNSVAYWDIGSVNSPVLEVNTTSILLRPAQSSPSFTIANVGSGNLDWTINTSATWLTCTPSNSINQSTVQVNVNWSELSTGSIYNESITISSNGGTHTISVNIDNSIAAQNEPPIAVILTAESINTPLYYYFNASASTDDNTHSTALAFRWSLDTGAEFSEWSMSNMYVQHQYTTPGSKHIILQARDEQGAIGEDSIELEVVDNSVLTETEPNNSSYSPNSIPVNTTISGDIGYGTDEYDWIELTMPSNGQIQLEISNLHTQNVNNGSIGAVVLYDANLNQLTRFGANFQDRTSPGSSSMSDIIVVSANTNYYVLIQKYSDHAAPYSLTNYFQ